jgi:exodeoxyribonuclease VIII
VLVVTMSTTRPMGLIKDMPFEDYLKVDAFSNSDMKLLARSAWHWKNRIEPVKQTRPMLRGSLAHCAQLEPHALHDRYVFVPEDAPRRPTDAQWNAAKSNESSAAAKAWWAKFTDDLRGREIVTAAEFAVTRMQLAALAAEPTLATFLATGFSECSIFWVDRETGIYCKARPDHVYPEDERTVTLLDLKSTVDESPDGFGRTAARMGYHRQAAHYTEGFRRATGLRVEKFVFGAVTSAPPVLAVPYVLTDEIFEQAKDERRELLELYARCKRDDRWPTYGTGLQLLDFPAYAKRSNEVEVSFAD